MQEKLIIYLHANDLERPTWATSTYHHRGETDSLAEAAVNREVVVVVPGEDILLLTLNLPKLSRHRLQQALPYALEEHLASDVDELHFAVGHYQADGSLPVAVVSHEKMQTWLALLKTWRVLPNEVIPETLVLPYEENTWQVVLHDKAVVRTGLFQGYACDRTNFLSVLSLALMDKSPQKIQLNNYTAQSIETPITNMQESVFAAEQFNDWVASISDKPSFNLLQQKYAVKKSTLPKLTVGWKVVMYLAACWVFALFCYPTVSYLILSGRVRALDKQIAKIYFQQFPDAHNVIAPTLRMQEKWEALSGKGSQNELLKLLAVVGKGISANTGIKLGRLDFQNNQLTVELTASSSANFSAFNDYLLSRGLNVKQQNANLALGHVGATLQIG